MKNLNRILLVLFVYFNTVGCSSILSPKIGFKNLSEGHIKEINGTWNAHHLVGDDRINPASWGGEESFYIAKKSEFFGPVHFEWKNSSGQKIIKEFIFKKEDMPSLGRKIIPTM